MKQAKTEKNILKIIKTIDIAHSFHILSFVVSLILDCMLHKFTFRESVAEAQANPALWKSYTIATYLTQCVSVGVCVGAFVCKPSPPVTCGHMVQSWPILGRQGEEESRSKEGGKSAVLHPILAAAMCLFTFTD